MIDTKNFRTALGLFPTGVAVVTGLSNKQDTLGITINSFNSVSLEPPLVLWCIDHKSMGYKQYCTMQHFAINILSKNQIELSNRFAQRSIDKFAGINYQTNSYDVPILEGCCANFHCKLWQLYQGGDHTIIVGEVIDFHYNRFLEPLVFSCGSYNSLSIVAESFSKHKKVTNKSIENNRDLCIKKVRCFLCKSLYYAKFW